ncbi:MAG: aspartyl-tRNA(Asn)/glutamyl-tRNA(Gln) amidotransferase subunit [Rhodospirillaceae bacterium]|nr:aspartyl-tRNA(Asn)/glutamyl-tRNA(Gln) amidotransferase subunit [Rhodospirillaceae bacterium]
MSQDIALMPAIDLVRHYRARTLSPVEATRAALERIARLNPRLNAYRLVDDKSALAAARDSEARWMKDEPIGPLDGVTASVKDLLVTRGWPTLRGSKAVDPNQSCDEDAPTVARLREAGAVLLGKTTTPEFGWKGVTDSPLTGITRNPWDDSRTPGGSSGGAAVAAACGMGALHLGTDGGGSIRIPASFTGIFGFKQSFGRVPASPLSPFGTLAHVGPMTRSVEDAALMLSVIARPDPRDWYAIPYDGRDYLDGLDDGIRGLKIAFSPRLGGHTVEADIARVVAEAVSLFRELGATVEEAEPEIGTNCGITFANHWFPGAANALRGFSAEQRALMDPGLCEIAASGARLPLLDYLASVKEREQLGVRMNQFHEKWDLLLTPTTPLAAFQAGVECPVMADGSRWTDWTPFTYPFNLTRQPAASLPCGFTAAGLPVGLQIVGPSYGDAAVLRAARAFEKLRPFKMPNL